MVVHCLASFVVSLPENAPSFLFRFLAPASRPPPRLAGLLWLFSERMEACPSLAHGACLHVWTSRNWLTGDLTPAHRSPRAHHAWCVTWPFEAASYFVHDGDAPPVGRGSGPSSCYSKAAGMKEPVRGLPRLRVSWALRRAAFTPPAAVTTRVARSLVR